MKHGSQLLIDHKHLHVPHFMNRRHFPSLIQYLVINLFEGFYDDIGISIDQSEFHLTIRSRITVCSRVL